MTSLEKNTFCCKVMTKIRAEHLFEKVSFANALLDFSISGREGQKVPCTSTSSLPWLSGRKEMFYLLSAEQAWLHFLQAVLTPLGAALESRSPELLFQVCRSALWQQPPDTGPGCSLNTGTHSAPNASHLCSQNGNLSNYPSPSALASLVQCLLSFRQLTSGCGFCRLRQKTLFILSPTEKGIIYINSNNFGSSLLSNTLQL